tara:strand:+ start:390 stop:704 length:315 start_codon:yes stop_codon:yes gene_type:complete
MIKKNFFSLLILILLINKQAKSDSMLDIGKDIFLNKASCSTCHTLKDAGSEGQIGPNLNDIRPEKITVMNAVTNGIGVMPAYEGELSKDEIEAVSHYVSTVSQQ